MSAAVEPTQPTDEAVELAGEVFYGPVWDGADSHAGVEVRAALAAAYPVMVKQAIADALTAAADAVHGQQGRPGIDLLTANEILAGVETNLRARAGGGDHAID